MPNTALFPMPFALHIGFVCVSVIVFIIGFIKNHYAYRVVMAEAVLCSLLVYLSKSGLFFTVLGIVEGVLFITGLILRHFERYCPEKLADKRTEEPVAAPITADVPEIKTIETIAHDIEPITADVPENRTIEAIAPDIAPITAANASQAAIELSRQLDAYMEKMNRRKKTPPADKFDGE